MTDPTRAEILIGTGGIGSGIFLEIQGGHTLGRNESRGGVLRDWRDYCKLHIIAHYFAVLGGGSRGIRILPVGKVGGDPIGQRLLQEMAEVGMDLSLVETVTDAPTLFSVCLIYPDSTGGNITSVNSASGCVGPTDLDRLEPEMKTYRGLGIALAVPEVPLAARARLLSLATRYGFFRAASFTTGDIHDAKSEVMLRNVDLLALNVDEAAALAGSDGSPEAIRAGCARWVGQFNAEAMLCVTAGPQGSWVYHQGNWEYLPVLGVRAANTAGAGDAYLAGVLSGLAKGLPFLAGPLGKEDFITRRAVVSACEYAVVVAAFSVTSPHTIHPDLNAEAVAEFAAAYGIVLPGAVAARGPVPEEERR